MLPHTCPLRNEQRDRKVSFPINNLKACAPDFDECALVESIQPVTCDIEL